MDNTITTEEWYDARYKKPPKDRLVLCRFDDGHFNICKHNGMYWVGQHNMRLAMGNTPTHFYIFEKFNENDIL